MTLEAQDVAVYLVMALALGIAIGAGWMYFYSDWLPERRKQEGWTKAQVEASWRVVVKSGGAPHEPHPNDMYASAMPSDEMSVFLNKTATHPSGQIKVLQSLTIASIKTSDEAFDEKLETAVTRANRLLPTMVGVY